MTEEAVAMLEWMRRHNAASGAAPQVRFYGMDLKLDAVPDAVEQVATLLAPLGGGAATEAREHYVCLLEGVTGDTFYGALPATDKAACRARLEAAYELLEANRDDLVAATSRQAYGDALRSARMVLQAEEAYGYGDPDASDTDLGALLERRDRFMAENVAWILENRSPAGRMILWAHNAHVATRDDLLFGGRPAGALLEQRYGDDYLAVGFAMHGGESNAFVDLPDGGQEMRASELPPPPDDAYEAILNRAGPPLFALDLRGLDEAAPETAWLFGPRPLHHFVGASYSLTDPTTSPTLADAALAHEHDLLVLVEETSPTRFLPVTVVFGFPVETERAADPSGRLSAPLLPGRSAEERDGHTLLTAPTGARAPTC